MKLHNYFLLLLVSSAVFSQSKQQRMDVVKNTDIESLHLLSNRFNSEFAERQKRIDLFLRNNPKSFRVSLIKGRYSEIYDVTPSGEVLYYQTSNFNSAVTSRANKLYSGGSLGLNIQGQGMTAYVWDGGGARSTHVEFPNGKVTFGDDAGNNLVDHSTHVMGTIVAQGITPALRGNAFDASGISYNWTNDYSEMTNEAANGMLVSNHSYWIGSGTNSWIFGAYDSRAMQFDLIASAAPYYLAVTAAGNDRSDINDPVIGPLITEKYGYNLTRGMQNAKNFLTVGAVYQVLNYTNASSVQMASFSSWGPTDDGRIKPEIVDKGVAVTSTLSTSDTAKGPLQGTSMASPGVAGTALLLQQYYFSLNASYMRAATLKGLILHTADEAGYDPDIDKLGPDYEFGWGLINAEKASIAIAGKQTGTAAIDELQLTNNQVFTKVITANGSQPLMVSISWTDPAGVANTTNAVDPTNLNLVNDLDVRVIKGTNTYFPWTLDPAEPYNPAVRTSDNFRDNFEKIQVDNPNGTYSVVVTHKGTSLSGGLQKYTLIITGPGMNLSSEDVTKTAPFVIYPNPSKGVLNVNYDTLAGNFTIELYDVQGRLIQKQNSSQINTTLDISNYSNGLYIVKCTDGSKSITQKIILSK